jgi:creatinine amidohydrolase
VDIDLVGGMKAGKKTFAEMGADAAYFGQPAAASALEGHDTYARLADIVTLVLLEILAPVEENAET